MRIGSENVVGHALFWRLDQQLGLSDGSGVRWLDCKLSVRKSNDRDKESVGSSNAYTRCTPIPLSAMSSSNAFNFRIEWGPSSPNQFREIQLRRETSAALKTDNENDEPGHDRNVTKVKI